MAIIGQELFFPFVTLAALAYSVLSAVIQRKVGDYKRTKEIQQRMNALNKELNEAMKSGDKARIEVAHKRQLEAMGEMNTLMMLQFKPLIIILILFGGFLFALDNLDPYREDDIGLRMFDSGAADNCDAAAGDGIYSACHKFNKGSFGAWTYSASVHRYAPMYQISDLRLFEDVRETGTNSTELFYEGGKRGDVKLAVSGESVKLYASSNASYREGDIAALGANPSKYLFSLENRSIGNVKIGDNLSGMHEGTNITITVSSIGEGDILIGKDGGGYTAEERDGNLTIYQIMPLNLSRGEFVLAKLDSGTAFYVELPFTIPIINVKRLNDIYGWFVLCIIVFGLVLSLVLQKILDDLIS